MSLMWAAQLGDLLVGDGEAELGFGLGEPDPELPPGAELALVGPEGGHLARGVAGDERVVVGVVHGEAARSEERGARVRSALTIDFVHRTSFLFWWFVEGGDGEEDDQADEAGGPDYFADDADVDEHADAGGVAHGLQESGDPNEDGSDDRQGDREGEECFGGGAEGHGLGADSLTTEFTDGHGSGMLLKRPRFRPGGERCQCDRCDR